MTFDYDAFLESAHARLEALYEQKGSIEREITALQLAIRGFIPLAKDRQRWVDPDVGITQAITTVMESDTSRLWTAPSVRDELVSRGIALKQKNPLATIHQVLTRLADRGEVRPMTFDERTRYKWATEEELEEFKRQKTARIARAKEELRKK